MRRAATAVGDGRALDVEHAGPGLDDEPDLAAHVHDGRGAVGLAGTELLARVQVAVDEDLHPHGAGRDAVVLGVRRELAEAGRETVAPEGAPDLHHVDRLRGAVRAHGLVARDVGTCVRRRRRRRDRGNRRRGRLDAVSGVAGRDVLHAFGLDRDGSRLVLDHRVGARGLLAGRDLDDLGRAVGLGDRVGRLGRALGVVQVHDEAVAVHRDGCGRHRHGAGLAGVLAELVDLGRRRAVRPLGLLVLERDGQVGRRRARHRVVVRAGRHDLPADVGGDAGRVALVLLLGNGRRRDLLAGRTVGQVELAGPAAVDGHGGTRHVGAQVERRGVVRHPTGELVERYVGGLSVVPRDLDGGRSRGLVLHLGDDEVPLRAHDLVVTERLGLHLLAGAVVGELVLGDRAGVDLRHAVAPLALEGERHVGGRLGREVLRERLGAAGCEGRSDGNDVGPVGLHDGLGLVGLRVDHEPGRQPAAAVLARHGARDRVVVRGAGCCDAEGHEDGDGDRADESPRPADATASHGCLEPALTCHCSVSFRAIAISPHDGELGCDPLC